MIKLSLSTMLVVGLLASCTPVAPREDGDDTGEAEQAEKWARDDDPTIFAADLERRAEELPASGEASPVPWAGSYWPAWRDSINTRWDGDDAPSPAAKYERAFDGHGVEDAVSEKEGIDSLSDAKECTRKRECEKGEVCAKRRGASSGRCAPIWFGICDGWAAASILYPEPVHEVTRGDVTFKVQDIKALLTLSSTVAVSKFLSKRCEKVDSKGEIHDDADGRPPPACRDTNAGTFHVVLGNYVGLRHQSFVEDIMFDEAVWNHPIRGYKVVRQETVTKERALRLVRAAPEDDPEAPYRFNPEAASLVHVKNDVSYITESVPETDGNLSSSIDDYTVVVRYEYVLELDADGAIVGGEWAGRSKRDHPDFLWLPVRAGTERVAGGKISHATVKSLADESVAPAP